MYERFYNLIGKPFQLSPDPAFFYGSRGHKRAAAYLEYGVEQGEGFIVITGEVGAGKTTLVRNLFRSLPLNRVVAAQIVSTQLDANDMLGAVCSAFGLGTEGGKAERLFRLEKHLQACQRAGKRCLLVVDEAQNLSPATLEELRMLSNFQSDSGSLLQSFLVGQPEFRDMFQGDAMRQLRQRVIATCHLGPLNADETREYIEHRLRKVGWEQDPSFTDAAFDALHRYSEGVPRRINTVCDRLLLMASLEERHEIDADGVQEVVDELDQDFGVREQIPAPDALQPPTDDPPAPTPPASSQPADDATHTAAQLERFASYTTAVSRRILKNLRQRH
ncbi:XrtA/PEP-CTERM system-associated ATPase [Spiribacter vilamensis]|uniref:Putative secretion ATPase (PEP-CTERM system associated) n=1 Tax=Spiribacter vilamensis TaxID=531306 RepID=A0A4Q8CZK7_9GAMM|nr:XrtA/PEP-CTERM system-associated ATPase [Spiribacter vilamensis]RZU98377.1 putative secretion ATPase (PEP-CTERM system associated) [Spiribacter vilamensis]TVO60741.1 AAA family ATPase [Spiribacter vilamensis]